MRTIVLGTLAALSIGFAGQAEAKGCIKGAIVGGIASTTGSSQSVRQS